jgi:hypothetical protein
MSATSPDAAGLRAILTKKIATALRTESDTGADVDTVAAEIEVEVNERFTKKEYSAKGRSLVFNLNKNAELRARVLAREVPAAWLVTASVSELATDAQKLARQVSAERFYAQRSVGASDELVVGWNAGTSGKLDWSHKYESEQPSSKRSAGLIGSAKGGSGGGGGAIEEGEEEEEEEEEAEEEEEGVADTEPEKDTEGFGSGGGGGSARWRCDCERGGLLRLARWLCLLIEAVVETSCWQEAATRVVVIDSSRSREAAGETYRERRGEGRTGRHAAGEPPNRRRRQPRRQTTSIGRHREQPAHCHSCWHDGRCRGRGLRFGRGATVHAQGGGSDGGAAR